MTTPEPIEITPENILAWAENPETTQGALREIYQCSFEARYGEQREEIHSRLAKNANLPRDLLEKFFQFDDLANVFQNSQLALILLTEPDFIQKKFCQLFTDAAEESDSDMQRFGVQDAAWRAFRSEEQAIPSALIQHLLHGTDDWPNEFIWHLLHGIFENPQIPFDPQDPAFANPANLEMLYTRWIATIARASWTNYTQDQNVHASLSKHIPPERLASPAQQDAVVQAYLRDPTSWSLVHWSLERVLEDVEESGDIATITLLAQHLVDVFAGKYPHNPGTKFALIEHNWTKQTARIYQACKENDISTAQLDTIPALQAFLAASRLIKVLQDRNQDPFIAIRLDHKSDLSGCELTFQSSQGVEPFQLPSRRFQEIEQELQIQPDTIEGNNAVWQLILRYC